MAIRNTTVALYRLSAGWLTINLPRLAVDSALALSINGKSCRFVTLHASLPIFRTNKTAPNFAALGGTSSDRRRGRGRARSRLISRHAIRHRRQACGHGRRRRRNTLVTGAASNALARHNLL